MPLEGELFVIAAQLTLNSKLTTQTGKHRKVTMEEMLFRLP